MNKQPKNHEKYIVAIKANYVEKKKMFIHEGEGKYVCVKEGKKRFYTNEIFWMRKNTSSLIQKRRRRKTLHNLLYNTYRYCVCAYTLVDCCLGSKTSYYRGTNNCTTIALRRVFLNSHLGNSSFSVQYNHLHGVAGL